MHKIASKPFELADFSYDHMNEKALNCLKQVIEVLEALRLEYLETKDKEVWYSMIQLLPTNYHQMRTCTLNYETITNIYYSRRYHKLDEWHDICSWIESLPYDKEIILVQDQK